MCLWNEDQRKEDEDSAVGLAGVLCVQLTATLVGQIKLCQPLQAAEARQRSERQRASRPALGRSPRVSGASPGAAHKRASARERAKTTGGAVRCGAVLARACGCGPDPALCERNGELPRYPPRAVFYRRYRGVK